MITTELYMKNLSKFAFSHLAIAMAILSATALVTTPQSALAQKEQKEKKKSKKEREAEAAKAEANATPQLTISRDFLTTYQAGKALVDAGTAAQVDLAAAEAMISNDSDRYVFGDLTYSVGKALNDRALELKGIEIMLPSPYLPAQNKPVFLYVQGSYALDRKEFSLATTKFDESYGLGFRGGSIEILQGIAHSNNGQAATAINWYERAIARSKESGQEFDLKGLLGNMAIAAIRSENGALIDDTFRKILPQTMDDKLWHDGLSQLIRNNNFSEQENLDILRLMAATDSMLFLQEYSEYVQAADPRRLPNEVLDVLNVGVQKGHIPENDLTFREFREAASARLAADKADLPAAEADAKKSSDGNSARATADALLSYDEYARAIAMYKLAIEKGVQDVDRARNRLGIAQLKNGDYEAAIASFGALTTPSRQSIGAYWMIYAKNLQAANNAPASAISANAAVNASVN